MHFKCTQSNQNQSSMYAFMNRNSKFMCIVAPNRNSYNKLHIKSKFMYKSNMHLYFKWFHTETLWGNGRSMPTKL